MRALCLICLTLFLAVFCAYADDSVSDSDLEARAKAINQSLRCVVCQNQTIDESAAPLAEDMRRLVRQRLEAGDTDEEVRAYMVERYDYFVLMRPPVKPFTWPLWFLPGLIAAAALIWLLRRQKTPAAPNDDDFSDEDRQLIDTALGRDSAS